MSKTTKSKGDISALDDLLSSVDHEFQTFPILGKEIELRPVTVLECVRLVKRFPALLQMFEPKLDEKGKPLPDHLQPSLISVVADAGSGAVAGWVACSANRERDLEFETSFASKPDTLTLPLFAASAKVTFGKEGVDGFFSKVQMALAEAGVALGQSDSIAA